MKMSVLTLKPKTIIVSAAQPLRPIQAVSPFSEVRSPAAGKRTIEVLESFLDTEYIYDDESVCDGGTRKRQRLTYLSAEEKMTRRKLKNRVAAQTARDRKKQLMCDLEEQLAILQAQNRELEAENGELRQSAVELSTENARLRERLETRTQEVATRTSSDVIAKSAVLDPPLPQEMTRTPVQLVANFVMFLAILSLTHGWGPTKSVKSSQHSQQSVTTANQSLMRMSNRLNRAARQNSEWWGRHQRSWNPSTT